MSEQVVLHVWGFGAEAGRMVSGVGAAIIPGDLSEVAESTIEGMRSHGHDVKVSTVRTLDGWLREVHAVCPVDPDNPMWHRFLTPGEQWKRVDGRESREAGA